MRYEFVHKRFNDWSFEELEIIDRTIEFVNNPIEGNPFLAIGKFLAEIAYVKFLIIGRLEFPAAETVRTVCFLNYGQQIPDITYKLEGTPCQHMFTHNVCYYPFGVKEEFPNDPELQEMNIGSYMGTPLIDKDNNRIGLVVLIDEVTIPNPGFLDYILTLVSPVLENELLLAREGVIK